MTDPKVTHSAPGVYIEETRTSVKVIPGVATSTGSHQSKTSPSALIAAGYKIIATSIESGGLALLLEKGADHVLVRMTDYRDGTSVEGHLLVTFVGKVP
jgi:hypothetical protein